MKVGFDSYTISHRGWDALTTLDFAGKSGLEGVQLLDPGSISASLSESELVAVKSRADQLGLYLEVGIPSPNPARRERELGYPVSVEDQSEWLRRNLEAIAVLGCKVTRAFLGDRHDRFRKDVAWAAQREASVSVLRLLAPTLKALGVRIALETHADQRSDELLALIDRVGDDVLGVTLDTGNLAMRLDDPLRATERLAPLVLVTHVKDAVLMFSDRGLRWQARAVGAGVLPIGEMLEILRLSNPFLNLSIELHPRTYDLPIFDPSWMAHFPGLEATDLAACVALAWRCERKCNDGSMDRPEVVEAIPWSDRDLLWLDQSAKWLLAWRNQTFLDQAGPRPIASDA
jgi:sugar phosphate isomerase/epimerase